MNQQYSIIEIMANNGNKKHQMKVERNVLFICPKKQYPLRLHFGKYGNSRKGFE
jgi:hypothetical protein